MGFVALETFRFTTLKDTYESYENQFLCSLTLGFVIKSAFLLLPTTKNHTLDMVLIVIFTVLLSYLFTHFYNSSKFDEVLDKLQIKRTKQKYIWYDIMEDKYGVYIDAENPEDNIRYVGKIVLVEESQRQPLVQISEYIMYKDGEEVYNYSDKKNRTILIDTSVYSCIEINYQECSNKYKNW